MGLITSFKPYSSEKKIIASPKEILRTKTGVATETVTLYTVPKGHTYTVEQVFLLQSTGLNAGTELRFLRSDGQYYLRFPKDKTTCINLMEYPLIMKEGDYIVFYYDTNDGGGAFQVSVLGTEQYNAFQFIMGRAYITDTNAIPDWLETRRIPQYTVQNIQKTEQNTSIFYNYA